ncbi:hypothetical protein PRIPAC_91323 [Pristionchus pacificus]|uniref:Uncharacterized protein n=1 Tax=Pristionchus pacificus TaxID=54126 RepID=A0A2A6B3T9_PRIPA|nr:hypothetical protein PRIPAC_91323 [Pristionchus pacificus]|eukprot:PDM60528.1 hypothetical protein PRIPAC_53506 [Pristionchus pacificus]
MTKGSIFPMIPSLFVLLLVSRTAYGCGAGGIGGNEYEIIQDPVFNMDISPPVGWTFFPPPTAAATAALLFAGQSNDTAQAKMRADTEIMAAMIEAMLDASLPLTSNVQVTNTYQPEQFANVGTAATADMTYGRLEGGAITGISKGGTVVPPIYTPYMKSVDVTIRNMQTTRYTWNIVRNNFLQKMALNYNAKFHGEVTPFICTISVAVIKRIRVQGGLNGSITPTDPPKNVRITGTLIASRRFDKRLRRNRRHKRLRNRPRPGVQHGPFAARRVDLLPAAAGTAAMFFVGQSNDTVTAKMRADTEIQAAMIEAMVAAQLPVYNVQITNNYQPDDITNPAALTTGVAGPTYGKLEGGAITGIYTGTGMIIYTPYLKMVDVTIRNAQTTRYTWNLVKNNFLQKMALNYNAKFTAGNSDYTLLQDPVFNMDISPPVGWTYFPPAAAAGTAALFFVGQSNDTTTAKMRADTEITAAMIEAMVEAQLPVTNVLLPGWYGQLAGGAITGTYTGTGTIAYLPYAKMVDVTIRNAVTTRSIWNQVKNNFLQKMALNYNAKFTGDITANSEMTEVCSRVPTETGDTLIYHLYLWEGLFIIIFNSLLVMIILKEYEKVEKSPLFSKFIMSFREKLRAQKECSLYAGCLVFEVLFGVTYSVAGAFRLAVHYSNEYYPMHSAFGCLIQPHVIMFVYITPCVVCMMFLLVVLMPVPFLAVSFGTSAHLSSVPSITECALNTALTEEVYITLRATRVVFSLLGALLYIPIIIRIRMFCANSSRRILRTTMTVLLICLSTLSLYTIPDIVLLVNPHFPSKFFYVANLNKGVVNVFIFLLTQRTIRDAVIKALRRKRRPHIPNTTSWKNGLVRPESGMSKKERVEDK